MIELVNARTVPVWIDIRTSPVPDVPGLDRVMLGTRLDGRRRVADRFSRGFFLRSVVLTPDAGTVLNPRSERWGNGHFPYAEVKPEDYLAMLREALAAHPGVGS